MRKALVCVIPAAVGLAAGALLWASATATAQSTGVAGTQQAMLIPNSPIQPLPQQVELDGRKVALGRRLFFDPRFSRNDTVSCASCHDIGAGGADSVDFSVGIGGARTAVNSPSVLNSGFNFAQFWDGRADDGRTVGSGTYFYTLDVEGRRTTKAMVFMK